jgi:hypothetical protein
MPEPCNKCGFVHRTESACPEQLSLDMLHRGYENQQPEMAEQESIDMGLLSKYKPRDNNNFKQFKRRDFLKKEHFPKSGELQATIIELRDAFEGSYSDMLLDIKCGKTEYTVGIKNDSVLLDQLVQALGQDEKKWRNKSVTFELAKGKYINLKRERASGKQSRPKSRKATAKR